METDECSRCHIEIRPLPLPPCDGEVGICMRCSLITIFTGDGMERREPTQEELLQIRDSPGYMPIMSWIWLQQMAHRREMSRWN